MNFSDVEAARKRCLQKINRCLTVSLIIVAVIIVTGLILWAVRGGSSFGLFVIYQIPVILLCVSVSAVVTIVLIRGDLGTYRKIYKAYFVEKNLASIFTDLNYRHEIGLNKELLRATEMIDIGDVYYSNDLTTGKYKDVSFMQADVHIEEEHTDSSNGEKTYSTIFKGRFMVFEFPKIFNFRLEVAEKGFGASKVPEKNPQTNRKFERVRLESSEFEKIFRVFAEDGFEAFYILDPSLIDSFTKMSQKYTGKLLFCFVDNRLIVGLKDGKDAFEPPSIFKTIDERVEREKVAQDIKLITDFVDQLKLNHKLFK